MAKSNKITTQGRELRIKSCETCHGKPESEPYNSPPFSGLRCIMCWEILTIIKEGVEVKKKISRVKRETKTKSKIPKILLINMQDELILL